MRFYGRLFDIDKATLDKRIAELIEMTGLTQTGSRTIGEFSKGMARRVGLAQALINDPELVILDEPTSVLDPIGTRQVKDLILTLAKRGKTVLLSSHLLADVEDICDEIAILYNGKLCAHGEVSTLLEEDSRIRLTLPDMPEDQLQALVKIAQEMCNQTPNIDRPKRHLEQFFLDVVRHAQSSGVAQTGAETNDKLADFLADKQ